MQDGKHQVADKSIWKFGIQKINPLSSGNEIKRKQWIKLCSDCHEPEMAAKSLTALDQERKRAWDKLFQAESLLKGLRRKSLLYPSARQRPPYPGDAPDKLWPREAIGFLEGQSSAFYNVSPIERNYFEMWYFSNLGAYKGAAHGDASFVAKGHQAMELSLESIRKQAETLRTLGKTQPTNIWLNGEYTDYNREHN